MSRWDGEQKNMWAFVNNDQSSFSQNSDSFFTPRYSLGRFQVNICANDE